MALASNAARSRRPMMAVSDISGSVAGESPAERCCGQPDIDDVDGDRSGHQRLEVLHRMGEVGQAGAGIVIGQLMQLPFPLDAFGDVGLVADVMGEPPGVIAHRGDMQLVPEGPAVASIVPHHGANVLPLGERGTHRGDHVRFRVGALQESAVAAEDLVRRITGQLDKRRVDVDERVVVGKAVGDGDAQTGVIDRVDQGGDRKVRGQRRPLRQRVA